MHRPEETRHPLCAIQTQDKPFTAELRAATRPAHLEYRSANQHLFLAAGALINDDGTGGNGGILLVDTDDRAAAERFIAEDPFTKAGLVEKVTVTRWRKAFFDKKRLDLTRACSAAHLSWRGRLQAAFQAYFSGVDAGGKLQN